MGSLRTAIATMAVLAAFTLAACPRPVAPTPPVPMGELELVVEPPGPDLQVFLDGEPLEVGGAGKVVHALAVGTHRVQVERDGYYAVWRLVDVPAPPARAALHVTLHEVVP